MAAEGVGKIVVVTDDPPKYNHLQDFPSVNAHGATGDAWRLAAGVTIHHRDELDQIQRELRELPDVSVLIYDQTCASEKRRRRKRNEYPDPPGRVVINELVCEGCGDCSTQSNCLSVEPLETEFGRKRTINQSSCNKDFSCVNGFCPSFVTIENGKVKKTKVSAGRDAVMPPELPRAEPAQFARGKNYGVVITGVGGTGVVTIGQLLGMASHLEGKGVSVLDMAGVAPKGGAGFFHVRIAPRPGGLFSTPVSVGGAGGGLRFEPVLHT